MKNKLEKLLSIKRLRAAVSAIVAVVLLLSTIFVLSPEKVEAEPFHATADMLQGTAYAVLTSTGELIFFRSNSTYTAGTGKTVTDIKGNTYTGRVYTRIESTGNSNPPWYQQRTSVKSVRVATGQASLQC